MQAGAADLLITEGQVTYPRLADAGNADALQARDQPTGEHIKMPTMVAERKPGYDRGYNHIAGIKNHGAPSAAASEDGHTVSLAGIKVQLHVRPATRTENHDRVAEPEDSDPGLPVAARGTDQIVVVCVWWKGEFDHRSTVSSGGHERLNRPLPHRLP